MHEVEQIPKGTASASRKYRTHDINCWLVFGILMGIALIIAKIISPELTGNHALAFANKYVGVSWPFFGCVSLGLLYVTATQVSRILRFTEIRYSKRINKFLHWATEACPLVGLLTTFLCFLFALLAYADAGPRQPEADAAFIKQFAIVLGSSIAGGVLSLWAFTLHRFCVPEKSQADD